MLRSKPSAQEKRTVDEKSPWPPRIGFERFADMDLTRAISREDTRADYGESRTVLLGPIDDRLHVATITVRGDRVRVISLRRANRREKRKYAEASQST